MSSRTKNMLFILLIVVIASVVRLTGGGYGISPAFQDDSLVVSGPQDYQFILNYSEIRAVLLREEFEPGSCISGEKKRNCAYGTWENPELGQYELCISTKIDPCLLIELEDGSVYVFNYESDDTTEALYTMIPELLQSKGYSIRTE